MRLLFAGYWSPDSQYFNFIFSLLKSLLLGRCSGGTILGSPPALSSISPVPSGEPAPGLSTKLFETFNWILMRSGENYFDKKIDKLIAKLKVWVNFKLLAAGSREILFIWALPLTVDPEQSAGMSIWILCPVSSKSFLFDGVLRYQDVKCARLDRLMRILIYYFVISTRRGKM